MAHEIDLKRYDIYTDLVVESYDKENLDEKKYNIDLLVLHYYEDMCIQIPKNVKLLPFKFWYSEFRLLVLKMVQHHLSNLLGGPNTLHNLKKSLSVSLGIIGVKRFSFRNASST